MASFILRIQSPNGTKRLTFPSINSTWSDLQRQIEQNFKIQINQQLISVQPLHKASFVTAPGSRSFAALGFKHGDLLYVAEPLKASQSSAEEKTAIKLTAECQHGPNGRCIHCSAIPIGYKPTISCNHGAGASCPNCSEYVKSESKDIASWLCNHPEYAFCPKCQPPPDEDVEMGSTPKKTCECTGSQKCVKCLNLKAAYKVDVIPYAQMMAEKRALCKYKHDSSTTCPLCAPPKEVSYKGNPKCRDGHRPWPLGMCGKCRPPNANLRLQGYRHVDGVSFKDLAVGEKFISEWQANPGLQRSALMFGKIIDEPQESQNKGAIRAEVYGLYMPPQEPTPTGVILLNDPHERDVIQVAEEFGLFPVGWIITTLPRHSDNGDEIFMSGQEIRQAAKYQNRFSDENGHSRFVTMVIQYNQEGVIEPKAYQISDQGVAMEKDGLLQEGSKVELLASRKGKDKEFVPSIIFKDRALKPGEDFIPDELLVKVVAMRPYKPVPLFKYTHFPLCNATKRHVLVYLKSHEKEPWSLILSDFALLCYLPQVVQIDVALEAARIVKGSVQVSEAFVRSLNSRLS